MTGIRCVIVSIKSITFAALKAHVVKLADTSDLGSDAARYGGSSPSMGTDNVRFKVISLVRKIIRSLKSLVIQKQKLIEQ